MKEGPEFIIAGDSHLFAFGAAQGYDGPACLAPIGDERGRGWYLMEKWLNARAASYWDALAAHAPERNVVLLVMGNQHFANFFIARPPPFDFLDPEEPQVVLQPGAVLVPRRLVRASPAFDMEFVRLLVRRLRACGCRDVFVCGTPPVRGDLAAVHDEVRRRLFFRRAADTLGIDIDTCEFTPAPVMKRLWRVLQESLADAARETGARFLAVPPGLVDADGYLPAQFRGPPYDIAHANDAYGRAMREHVVAAVYAAAG